MTLAETNKIIGLIRSRNKTNARLARKLVNVPVPESINRAVLDILKLDTAGKLRYLSIRLEINYFLEIISFLEDDLEELDMQMSMLSSLPESIGDLSSLQRLNLHNNFLANLPGSIGQLTKLRKLDLCCNQLSTLPKSIGQMTQLEWLHLHDNQLTTLPESIGQLSNLKWLYLGDNLIGAREQERIISLLPNCRIYFD